MTNTERIADLERRLSEAQSAIERAHAVIRKCVTAGVLRHDLNQFLADEGERLQMSVAPTTPDPQ